MTKQIYSIVACAFLMLGCSPKQENNSVVSSPKEKDVASEIKMVNWSLVDCNKRLPCIEGVIKNDSNITPSFIYAKFAVVDSQNLQLGVLELRVDDLSPGASGKIKNTVYYPDYADVKFVGFKVTP